MGVDTWTTWWQGPDGKVGVEHAWDAAAGVDVQTGERWWGTRVQLRRKGTRRWQRFVIVGTHPFDYAPVRAAILAELDSGRIRL